MIRFFVHRLSLVFVLVVLLMVSLGTLSAQAQPTPGYPERVLQWTVQKGETCADISSSLYKTPTQTRLIERYNSVRCTGQQLPAGMTLVVPETITDLPAATLRMIKPDVRARPASGGWGPAVAGMPLHRQHNVNTLSSGRADIRFIDRTRVVLAENTLVVIFGTAGQTRVSKTPPASVRLDEGEVQTGLAALRGDAVEVDVAGGRVSAQSRDTVVKKQAERTTVSVFDGSARVRSGGTTVTVPERMGTSFVRSKAPTPPRPLPVAPVWEDSTVSGVLLARDGVCDLQASWRAVPDAKAYRLEVARDEAFTDLVVREEVPKNVLAFRAEKLPAGNYFIRVQAIDSEDYLGIPTTPREFVLLATRMEGTAGEIAADRLVVHPYGTLSFEANPRIQMGLDDGPVGPVVSRLDFRQQTPSRIRLRVYGAPNMSDVPVEYIETSVTIQVGQIDSAGNLTVKVLFDGFAGLDIAREVKPVLRVRSGDDVRVVPLVASAPNSIEFTATLQFGSGNVLRLDVMDYRGRVLGTEVAERLQRNSEWYDTDVWPPPGVDAAPFVLSRGVASAFWGPGARSSGHLGGSAAYSKGDVIGQLHVAAVGRHGPFALDARVASNTLGGDADHGVDGSGWLGLRWTALGYLPEGRVAFEPVLRVAFPLEASGPDTRVEGAAAVGGIVGKYSWAFDLGVRVRVEDQERRTHVPSATGFLLTGLTCDAGSWVRVFGVIDAHLVGDGDIKGRGGISFGGETTGFIFGTLGLRLSPWDDAGGVVSGHLAIGIRDL
ncbi:MAG: FecR domain-containing protein [Polyangiaceae bacterium]|nr:FecR domain-containing protein [Polyangiaceae bacterium]